VHRVAPGIAAGILAPALLLATPSFAAAVTPTTVTLPAVSSSADEPDADDLRVAIARILAHPSISLALRAAANAALDDNTPEALRHFLKTGKYQVA
jgi:hypothetical protein